MQLAGTHEINSCHQVLTSICSLVHKPTNHWIIDSGATDHVTFQFDKLVNPVSVNAHLQLPNGQTILISHKGTVHLTDDLILHDVLFIPHFKYNLISGRKVTYDNNCCIQFFPYICLFQDLLQRTLKGIGRLDGGLYKFVPPS